MSSFVGNVPKNILVTLVKSSYVYLSPEGWRIQVVTAGGCFKQDRHGSVTDGGDGACLCEYTKATESHITNGCVYGM